MRITGIVSLRGNGRFLDFNSFEIDNINYILDNYSTYPKFTSKEKYFEYMGTVDSNVLSTHEVKQENIDDARQKTLNEWVINYTKEDIIKELYVVCGKGESKNPVLRIIDKPTRFEFLTSIALKQHFDGLDVRPNYHVDDEGLPTFTAAGGLADIVDELEERKKNLEEELYQEELDHPIVSEEQILHALYHYKSLDISTKEGKQRLIDGFVNSIYLYDDRYVITFNYKNKSKTVTFEEIESSSLTSKASPIKKPSRNCFDSGFLFSKQFKSAPP